MPKFTCAECDHYWTQHDLYGCQLFKCECRWIDRSHRYDAGAAVEEEQSEVIVK